MMYHSVMESYNNKIQIVFSIEVGWPEISDILETTRYSYTAISRFTKYVDWILGHLAYMSLDRVFSQKSTHVHRMTLFILLSKQIK